ncbi:hypothetical protein [Verrucosispora sp. TAA-831]|uniref:hypothetical protein n=1 Tax=Verrucosispora sp. TAA-831 TaxID=3422227 RepID=UPI003D6FDC5B
MTVRARVRPDHAGIARMVHQEYIYDHLEARADRVIIRAKVTAPARSYEYRSRIGRERFATARRAGVRVVARAPHSLIVERGSRPHVIEPRRKQALAWPGAAYPVARVHHPGTPAMHILRNALRAAGDR